MSNALLKAAHKVSGMSGTERAVLLVLADEARDNRGGVSTLTTAQIMARCPFSIRTIRRAYSALAEAGHITRIPGAPGMPFETKVHPVVAPVAAETGRPEWPGSAATVAGGTGHRGRGSIDIEEPVTISPRESAREADTVEGVADPVDQVFDAWDAYTRRAGQPGPITRDAARRVAVAHKLAGVGLGQVLMTIDTVERGVAAGGFRRKGAVAGQGDLFCTFDAVFEVGHAAALRLFTRLLDGEFGRPAESAAAPDQFVADNKMIDEPPRIAAIRAALAERLGRRAAAVWIDPLRFEEAGGELLAIAASAFAADYVNTQFAGELRRAAGGPLRVVVKEKV